MNRFSRAALVALCCIAILSAGVIAQDFTEALDRSACTFTTVGSNPYYPLWPGYETVIEEEEEDDGETITVSERMIVTGDTKIIDGVRTRVVDVEESEDGELVEIARNYVAVCRETGDVWYFGEDVEEYEDGELVDEAIEWRSGRDDAGPGLLMPGTPLIGAKYLEVNAPDEALDLSEITGHGGNLMVTAGTFSNVLVIEQTDILDPPDVAEKVFAPGVGLIKDEDAELVSFTLPPCQADETTHCLSNGRFRVQADWTAPNGDEGDGIAILGAADSGEFWFFNTDNTELIVKVLDACEAFGAHWVFAGGLTDVEVTIEVTDTMTGETVEYENEQGDPFVPVLDVTSFNDCP